MWHCGGGGGGARNPQPGGSGGNHPTKTSSYAGGGVGQAPVPDYSTVSTKDAKYASGGGGGGGAGGPAVIDSNGTYLTFASAIGGHGAPGVVIVQYTS